MTTTTHLLPVGTAVTILADTFGEWAATGTIAGYVTYTNERIGGRMEQGYAIDLNQGGYLDTPTVPMGCRAWVSMIVAHVESVEAIVEDEDDA